MQKRFNEDYFNMQEEIGGGDPLLILLEQEGTLEECDLAAQHDARVDVASLWKTTLKPNAYAEREW